MISPDIKITVQAPPPRDIQAPETKSLADSIIKEVTNLASGYSDLLNDKVGQFNQLIPSDLDKLAPFILAGGDKGLSGAFDIGKDLVTAAIDLLDGNTRSPINDFKDHKDFLCEIFQHHKKFNGLEFSFFKGLEFILKITHKKGKFMPLEHKFKDVFDHRFNLIPKIFDPIKLNSKLVLTWNAKKKLDLDLGLKYGKKHIFAKEDKGLFDECLLMKDNCDGDKQPEILHINGFGGHKGKVLAYVHQDSFDTLGTFIHSKATVDRYINGKYAETLYIKDAQNKHLLELIIPSKKYYWLLYCFNEKMQEVRVVNKLLTCEPTFLDCI